MCSLEDSYTSGGSGKEDYSGVSKIVLTRIHQNNDRAGFRQRLTFY